jgi:hypothetical protein
VDKELLFKPRAATASGMPEGDVDVPGVGTVRVRGMTRAEALTLRAFAGNVAKAEAVMLSFGMVDPALTEAEAARWISVSPATEIEDVTDKISELSGMKPTAAKEAVKEFVADPDAEFRVLPSGEVGHDAGPAADGDAEC